MTETKQSYPGDNLTFHAVANGDAIFKEPSGAYVFIPQNSIIDAFTRGGKKNEAILEAVGAIGALGVDVCSSDEPLEIDCPERILTV